MEVSAAPATTLDALLDGRLHIEQPARGHRAGTDAVLLAAAAPRGGGTMIDLGAGVGTAGLLLAAVDPSWRLVLVERDVAIARLAQGNAEHNRLADRVAVVVADVTASARDREAAGLTANSAEAVIANPPFFSPGHIRSSSDPYRRVAHGLDRAGELVQWVRTAVWLLKPRGTLTIIHRTEALPELLAAMAGRLGGISVLPVLPKAGAAASRILVRCTLGSRAPFCLLSPLVLHQASGGFTPEAEALHRGEGWIIWPGP